MARYERLEMRLAVCRERGMESGKVEAVVMRRVEVASGYRFGGVRMLPMVRSSSVLSSLDASALHSTSAYTL